VLTPTLERRLSTVKTACRREGRPARCVGMAPALKINHSGGGERI
jgi:hypothetical protein